MTAEKRQELRDQNAELHSKYIWLADALEKEDSNAKQTVLKMMMLDVEKERNDLLTMILDQDDQIKE